MLILKETEQLSHAKEKPGTNLQALHNFASETKAHAATSLQEKRMRHWRPRPSTAVQVVQVDEAH